jgi:hypothetical protein
MVDALSPTMTLRDFENGYWYLDQLKHFAERIGIPAAKKLRKDELEKAIVTFLRTGKAALPTERSLRKTGVKDVERGLNLKLRIDNYTSNRVTKDFIVERARLSSMNEMGRSRQTADGSRTNRTSRDISRSTFVRFRTPPAAVGRCRPAEGCGPRGPTTARNCFISRQLARSCASASSAGERGLRRSRRNCSKARISSLDPAH